MQAAKVWANLPQLDGALDTLQSDYLATQCQLLQPNAIQGVLIRISGSSDLANPVAAIAATWPELANDATLFTNIWPRAVQEQCGVVVPAPENHAANYLVALPILVDNLVVSVICLAVQVRLEADLEWIMGHLEWGSQFWVAANLREKRLIEQQKQSQLSMGVAQLAAVLSEADFASAAQKLVGQIATDLKCERVSFATVDYSINHALQVKLQNISQSADFSEQQALLRQIEAAMLEAVEQGRILHWPDSANTSVIVQAHEVLARSQGATCVVTLPLFDQSHDRYFGVFCLEKTSNGSFTSNQISNLEAMTNLAGSALRDKWLTQRSWTQVFKNDLRSQIKRLIGPGFTGRKLVLISFICLALFGFFFTGEYRLAAQAVVESRNRQIISTPYDAYIAHQYARAGDTVVAGTVLAELDTRDLVLERVKWLSEKAQLQRKLSEAEAQFDRAKVTVIRAQIDRAQAELDLAESSLQRAVLKAPFDGLLIEGDLSQRIGDVSRQGESLFVIATQDDYRLVVEIPESRIRDINIGQRGYVLLRSLIATPLAIEIVRITPITAAKEGQSYYNVEAKFDSSLVGLRPGMQGVAKVSIDQRRIVGIWFRDAWEWLQLALWRWFGMGDS